MTVNELHELLEKLALDDVTVDKSNYNRLFALSVLGMVEAVGIGVRGITDAGRELLAALRDRERMDALEAEVKWDNTQLPILEWLPERHGKTLRDFADGLLAAKPGAEPGGQEPGGEKLPEVAGASATTKVSIFPMTFEHHKGGRLVYVVCFKGCNPEDGYCVEMPNSEEAFKLARLIRDNFISKEAVHDSSSE